ncbi:MAG TPA: NfeD family protein [Nodosilinea sp.]|nr:NfeD family protein [Nodosilinea sp.]
MSICKRSLSAVLERKLNPGTGIVESVTTPDLEWVVRVNGVYWTARAALAGHSFQAGDPVRSVDREGNRLIIEPMA